MASNGTPWNWSSLLCEGTSGIDEAVSAYLEASRATPELRIGVSEGMRLIAEAGVSVVVVTEGDRERCLTLLKRHGLATFVGQCVSLNKSVEAYRSLRKMVRSGLMVGDQLDRDILFAGLAGFRTCYFPGGFMPFWAQEISVSPDHRIETYLEVPALLNPTSRRRHA